MIFPGTLSPNHWVQIDLQRPKQGDWNKNNRIWELAQNRNCIDFQLDCSNSCFCVRSNNHSRYGRLMFYFKVSSAPQPNRTRSNAESMEIVFSVVRVVLLMSNPGSCLLNRRPHFTLSWGRFKSIELLVVSKEPKMKNSNRKLN